MRRPLNPSPLAARITLFAASLLLTHCDRKAPEPESRPSQAPQSPTHVESSSWYRLEIPNGWRARNLTLGAVPGAVTDDAKNEFTLAFESRDGLNAVSLGKPQELTGSLDDFRDKLFSTLSSLSAWTCDKQGKGLSIPGGSAKLMACKRSQPGKESQEATLALFEKESTAVHLLCESNDDRSREQCAAIINSMQLKDDFKRVAREWVELSSSGYRVSVPPGWRLAPMIAVQRKAELVLAGGGHVAVLTVGRTTLTPEEALKAGLSPKDKELRRRQSKLLGRSATDIVVQRETGAPLFSRVAVDAGTLYDLECTAAEETCVRVADSLQIQKTRN
ncbi:MAG: hypothetical protein HY898_31250 [Deltaproteobacteria bacterium]|nr:hypothetical protein [Deltaproteobacteria bacterium]